MRGKVLVTGASGRVGRVLIPELIEKGYKVRALVHKRGLGEILPKQVEFIQGSLDEYETASKAVDGVAMVCHLASLLPPGQSREDRALYDNFSLFDVNVTGTFNLLEASRQAEDLRRFVLASTDATYPTGWTKSKYKAPISENQPQRPVLFYGLSKLLAEDLCCHYNSIYNIPTVVLRFFWVFSSQDVEDPQFILNLFSPKMWLDLMKPEDREELKDKDVLVALLEGDGTHFKDHVVDVRDVAQGILLSLEKDEAVGNIFNIAGPASFSYTEVVPFLSQALNKPYVQVRCPSLYAYDADIEKARNLLGFNPRYDIRKMLEDALSAATRSSAV